MAKQARPGRLLAGACGLPSGQLGPCYRDRGHAPASAGGPKAQAKGQFLMAAAGPALGTLSPGASRALVALAAGLFGLLIGSFLNVVVYRVPRGLSVVSPGSFCPSCGTPVRSLDNVPVLSWILLGGRCRSCRSPISPRYPLVEALTGGLFAGVAVVVGPHWSVPAFCVLAATVLAVAVIDLDGEPTPPAVPLVGGALGLALFTVPAATSGTWRALALAAIAALAALAAAAALRAGAGRQGPGTPDTTRAAQGAPFALVPFGVLLGWIGTGCTSAVAAGAATAAAAAIVIGLAWRGRGRGEEADAGAWGVVLGLPLAVALGAVVAFGVAAGQGALTGS